MFNYPGGKSHLSHTIVEMMPHHECYAEVFGGSAAVLLNKPESEVEIYNDKDGDLVHFFEVFRESHEELIEWLGKVPYSYEIYEDWARKYYQGGWRHKDDIKRAGIFFYLRYSQFGSKYSTKSGFARSKVQNQAGTYFNKVENLNNFTDRFNTVTIECLDWRDVVEKYDGEDTFFYFDPPYIDTEDYYTPGGFDHEEFSETLKNIEGKFILSYDKLPETLKDYGHVVTEDSLNYIDSGVKGETKETEEIFLMNYKPEEVRNFVSQSQSGIEQFSNNGTEAMECQGQDEGSQQTEDTNDSITIFSDE
jgi:DNA adenine methylase